MQALEDRANYLYGFILKHAEGSESILAVVGNAGVSVGVGLIAVNPIIGGAVTLLSAVTALIGNKQLKESERYKLEQIKSLSIDINKIAEKHNKLRNELNSIYLNNSAIVLLIAVLFYVVLF